MENLGAEKMPEELEEQDSKDPKEEMFPLEAAEASPEQVDSSSSSENESEGCSTDDKEEDVDHLRKEQSTVSLCRKVIPTLDEEDLACCSICLDDFTQEDPSISTTCGHGYHLQCIMQWSQRSRECPLCFHTLQLQDEGMNALLPFGEYVNPQQQAATAAMLENWEMERFLVQLAVVEQRERRAARQARRTSHPQVQISAPRPIFGARRRSEPGDRPSGINVASSVPNEDPNGQPGPEFPASWPPHHSGQGNDGENASSHGEGLSQAIKTRWASLRFRESLNKTTKELKSLFGAPSTSRSPQ